MQITDWEPRAFFEYFERISRIPRCSYHEKAIADYLCGFAKERGLVCLRDGMHNVMIKKPAQGCKGKDAVLLQGHTDMVCEKNAATVHDFQKDPIQLVVEGDNLRANGTTLGADNGVAVALMLAVLNDDAIVHPPLECLFTVQEEVGLLGAHSVDGTWIEAKTMINMDSGPDDTAIVSCAGGMRLDMAKRFAPQRITGRALRLALTGLMGGHSGTSIARHRANSNKLMGRILNVLSPFNLVSINGGSKDNAIPRECFAVIATDDAGAVKQQALRMADVIKQELSEADRGFCFAVEECEETPAEQMSRKDTDDIVSLLMLSPNGVLYMSHSVEGLVETSVNLGVIKTEGNNVTMTYSLRSSVSSKQEETESRLCMLGKAFMCDVRVYNRYPGWAYNPNSKARKLLQEAYRDLFGEDMIIKAIHAGLECGILLSKAPDLDAIAIGAEMHNAHTPDETLFLPSIDKVWKLLRELLKRFAA